MRHVRPEHRLAAIPIVGGTDVDACALFHRHADCLGHVARTLPVAADQDLTATRGTAGLGRAAGGKRDVAPSQIDAPALAGQAVGTELAAVVDHPATQLVGRLGGENYQAARRNDCVPVLDQCVDLAPGCGDAGQAAAFAEIQRDRLAGGERHGTHVRNDHAGVADLGCQQRDVTAQPGLEIAFVDDAAGGAVTLEGGLAGHEIVDADAVRGGDQAAHVDAGSGGEIHAVRVAQEDLAVGIELAEDLARVTALDAVEGDAARVGLMEVHLRGAADVERAPVDGRAAARLVDVHRGVALADACLTRDDLPARGQFGSARRGMYETDAGYRQGERREHQAPQPLARCATAARLATCPGDLGDSHPCTNGFVPDQTVDLVHRPTPVRASTPAGQEHAALLFGSRATGNDMFEWAAAIRTAGWPAARSGPGSGCRPGRCRARWDWGCCRSYAHRWRGD